MEHPTLQVLAKLNLNMYQNWIGGNEIHQFKQSTHSFRLDSYDVVGIPILSVGKY